MVTRNEELNWDYLLSPEFELINSAGKPLTDGYIEVYIAGTRNKYYCASDFIGTLHPFQIPLDALGSNIILADPANAYDVYVYNKYGSLIMSRYNVHCQGGNGGSSTYVGDRLFYGQYRASNVTTIANLSKNKGNINLSPEGYLKLKEDMSYHITVRGAFKVDDVSNVDTTLNYIEYSSVNPIKVDVDYTKEGPQYFELSYDLYRLPEDMDYQVAFDESNGMVTDLIVEVHSLSNLSTTAQDGGVYDSGWGIDITNNIISVDPSILEDYVTAEEVIAIVSGVTGLTPGSEYTAGDYISIVNNEISVTGINPEDYATHTEVHEATVTAIDTVTALIPDSEEVEFEEINLNDYALASAIPDVSDFTTHTDVYESIVTAIDFVTGAMPGGQVQSDWNETDESSPSYIQNKPDLSIYATHDEVVDAVTSIDLSDYTTHTEVYEATVTAVQVATGLIPELPDEEEVEFEEINLSDYALASAIPDVSDFTTHTEVHEAIVTAVNTVTSLIPDAQVQSDWAQETVTAVDFIKNKPDEVEIIAGQNIGLFEGEGTLTIAASAVDLSDYTTFEDVMEIVTGVTGLNDYGQFYATAVTGTAEMARTKGTIALTNDGKLKLVKGSSYHITVRGRYDVATAVNTFTDVSYVEAITNTGIHVNVDNTITDSQYFELSYDLYKLNSDTDYTVSFTGLAGSVNDLYLEIHSLDGIGGGGGSGPVTGGGIEYDAGWGINILNNVISVDSSILNNYATKDELQNSIETVTGLIPQSQVQSDWTEIDNSDPAYIKNKPQQVNLVAGQNIGITVTGANIVISASATDLSDYATIEQLQDSVELVTGLIPDVSDLVTDTELQSAISTVREEIPTIQLNANNQVTAINNYEIAGGSVTGTFVQVQSNWTEDDDSDPSYIQNKPSEQSLVAGNGISLTSSGNTVTISAEVPTVTGFVTEAQLQSVSGTLQNEIDNLPTPVVINYGDAIPSNLDLYYLTSQKSIPVCVKVPYNQLPADIKNKVYDYSDNYVYLWFKSRFLEPYGSDYSPRWVFETVLSAPNFKYPTVDTSAYILRVHTTSKGSTWSIDSIKLADSQVVVAHVSVSGTYPNATVTSDISATDFINAWKAGKAVYAIDTSNSNDVYSIVQGSNTETYPSLLLATTGSSTYLKQLFVNYGGWYKYTPDRTLTTTDQLDNKQNKLTAGQYISLANNIVAVTGIEPELYATKADLDTVSGMITPELPVVAGEGIGITETESEITITVTGNYVSDSDLQTAIQTVEAEIPVVTGYATKSELEAVSATIPELPDEEEVEFEDIDLSDYALISDIPVVTGYATKAELQTVSAAIPDTSDMATQTWVDNQGYLTSIPSNYVTETELTGAVSGFATKGELATVEAEIPVVTGFATKSELNGKQNTLTGITDIQVVNSLPGSPVATVLYLIPEV